MVKKLKKRKRDKCIIIPSTKLLCVNEIGRAHV